MTCGGRSTLKEFTTLTDSHWNPRGAYVAYVRIMQAISDWFPEARAHPAIGIPRCRSRSGPAATSPVCWESPNRFPKSD